MRNQLRAARCAGLVVVVIAGCVLGIAGETAAGAADRPIGHVFVINLENKGFVATWGETSPAPYLSQTLRSRGVFLGEYYAIGHPSLPNYVAQISGQGPSPATQIDCGKYTDFVATGTSAFDQVLGDGCVYPATVPTIADQLTAKGLTWKSYQEDIGNSSSDATTCRHPRIGQLDSTVAARPGDQYTTRHNPFMYFHSIIDSPACASNVVGLDALTRDLRTRAKTPNYSYITPNLCNSGHDGPCVDGSTGGLVSADAWLRVWVPKILKSPAYKRDGLLVITFDESEGADTSSCCGSPAPPNVARAGVNGPGGGRVGALLFSPFAARGTTSAVPYNHYSLLCSFENIFGLAHLGYAAQPGLACFGPEVYGGGQPVAAN
jgi:phosphatidylinositol-3-phosphatase